MTPEGERGANKSVAAMKAPRTQATVVKKPKTFWMRVKELYMMGERRRGGAAATGQHRGCFWCEPRL